jgi:hypothetical protein
MAGEEAKRMALICAVGVVRLWRGLDGGIYF